MFIPLHNSTHCMCIMYDLKTMIRRTSKLLSYKHKVFVILFLFVYTSKAGTSNAIAKKTYAPKTKFRHT